MQDPRYLKKRLSLEKEMVNHPDHYKGKDGKECIDCMIEDFDVPAVICFCLCNAYKYNFRAGKKEGNSMEQDKAKAEWYIKKAKELVKSYDGAFLLSKYFLTLQKLGITDD